mmetsp:Transcript_6562/g.13191  ORF Transcript_6562/g.13191 Transcript_6562/m.13191 type:complete len:244 (-) Transcript_6562:346-1077(-)
MENSTICQRTSSQPMPQSSPTPSAIPMRPTRRTKRTSTGMDLVLTRTTSISGTSSTEVTDRWVLQVMVTKVSRRSARTPRRRSSRLAPRNRSVSSQGRGAPRTPGVPARDTLTSSGAKGWTRQGRSNSRTGRTRISSRLAARPPGGRLTSSTPWPPIRWRTRTGASSGPSESNASKTSTSTKLLGRSRRGTRSKTRSPSWPTWEGLHTRSSRSRTTSWDSLTLGRGSRPILLAISPSSPTREA